jgi:5-methylcytosine-specific restriction endonuclease McrA
MTDSNSGENKRTAIFRRDAFRCVYCANVFTNDQLTLDHVQPLVKQGDNSPGNLVTACVRCNTRKGSRAAWDWLKEHPEEKKNFLRLATHIWPRLRRAVEQAHNHQ